MAANPDTFVDLTNADLSGGDLNRIEFSHVHLTGADLSGAALWGAFLGVADLRGANLRGANMNGAHLSMAQLINADLTRADLSNADLSDAALAGAILNGTKLFDTLFVNVDLSKTVGLDSCTHLGPSVLDHRTLLLSGELPLQFLRGCGLPDRLIDYLPSLLDASPIRFYSCFISYASTDQDFANRLHADLQSNGVRCWFAPHSLEAGKKIHEQIDEAIRVYDRLLLILSVGSMRSRWVKTEIDKARKKALTENRSVLFPIRLVPFDSVRDWEQFDADLGVDSAKEIREYFLPDFTHWKDHDAYTKSFDALLKALKSSS
jgi:hypothetical protein